MKLKYFGAYNEISGLNYDSYYSDEKWMEENHLKDAELLS